MLSAGDLGRETSQEGAMKHFDIHSDASAITWSTKRHFISLKRRKVKALKKIISRVHVALLWREGKKILQKKK